MASFRAFKLAVLLTVLWLASWPVRAQVTITVNASSSTPGFGPTNAVDQNPATFWSSAAHSTPNATERLRLDFGEALPLAGARLHPRFDGAIVLGFPVDFRLEYTTNTAAWTTVPPRRADHGEHSARWRGVAPPRGAGAGKPRATCSRVAPAVGHRWRTTLTPASSVE